MDTTIIISDDFIGELKKSVRTKATDANSEIKDLAQAAVQDMRLRGVAYKGETDPLTRQAIKLYCKGNYGYDEDAEKFQKAYEALRDSMALSGDYKEVNSDG